MENSIDELKREPVKPMEIWKGMTVNELVLQMKNSGAFSSGALAKAVDIYEQMIRDKTYIFLTLAGALTPAGLKKVIITLIEKGWVNAIVSTGANLAHDVLESFGGKHYKFLTNIRDDLLYKMKISRIYDVFVTDEDFEDKFDNPIFDIYQDIIEARKGEILSINDLLMEIAKRLPNEDSILKAAYHHNVKVFVPAIQDSAYGIEAVRYNRKSSDTLRVDAFMDLQEMWSIREKYENAGAVILGGGVPKNYVFQSSIFAQKKFNYVIQITLDRPETGGLSGATLDEAVSWGKIDEGARKVVVVSEVTLAFPIIVAALLERLS
ncbi:MAG: deoxyhypusine synthase family protein [archaeon]|nr:deoxyhypusine synthase family protein [archaeon]MCP8315360.1 deoxyhypusine synthase family protein [archaeon]MCP8321510.1 deoxyhypusine synthase family protein [archaeon]